MNRRQFLASAAAGAALVAAAAPHTTVKAAQPTFKLKYAPHFGMFRRSAGRDPIDQLKFMADQGFRALEDNGMRDKPVELQEAIAREMSRLDF